MSNGIQDQITPDFLMQRSTYCPEAIFTLGAHLEHLDKSIRDIDRDKHLCLGSILGSTPPVWVYVNGFYMSRWMITNGEYLRFMTATEEDQDGNKFYLYNDPELWESVWVGQNYRLTELKMPIQHGNDIELMIENYQGSASFVDAYVLSIRYEVERLLLGEEDSQVDPSLIEGLFDYMKMRLWDMMAVSDDDGWGNDPYKSSMSPEDAAAAIDSLVQELYTKYSFTVDVRFKQALRAKKFPVESILFLTRFRRALAKVQPQDPIPLHLVVFPRFWEAPPGHMRPERFPGQKVPWEQQPVYGITVYEAIAYTSWLSMQTGLAVRLPDEAEFERAGGWPLTPTRMSEPEILVDPRAKSILPWHQPGGADFRDYNSFFGQDGRDMAGFYFFNKNEYQNLLNETAKKAPDGQDILQLLGFGWQWTCDRYDPDERKWGRFDPRNYPVLRSPVCKYDPGDDPLPVFRYKANVNPRHAQFVLRGSPDVIGGPGTVTRRFSAYPLRGYRNVGFRFLFREA